MLAATSAFSGFGIAIANPSFIVTTKGTKRSRCNISASSFLMLVSNLLLARSGLMIHSSAKELVFEPECGAANGPAPSFRCSISDYVDKKRAERCPFLVIRPAVPGSRIFTIRLARDQTEGTEFARSSSRRQSGSPRWLPTASASHPPSLKLRTSPRLRRTSLRNKSDAALLGALGIAGPVLQVQARDRAKSLVIAYEYNTKKEGMSSD